MIAVAVPAGLNNEESKAYAALVVAARRVAIVEAERFAAASKEARNAAAA